jgi:hypothetical protein
MPITNDSVWNFSLIIMSEYVYLILESDDFYYNITSKIGKYVPYLNSLKNVLTMHFGFH